MAIGIDAEDIDAYTDREALSNLGRFEEARPRPGHRDRRDASAHHHRANALYM